ncbi:MAG TPA: hypothetical protein PKN24_08040 [bacterium]|nr:hypothetical protein [bacterium]
MKRLVVLTVLFLAFLLMNCASVNSEWKKALKADTIEAYETFLVKYPESEHSDYAKKFVDRLQWKKCQEQNTVKSYQYYISRFPKGEKITEAEEALDKLQWSRYQEQNTIEAYQEYLSLNPEGRFFGQAIKNIDNIQWQKAQQINTIEAYQDLLNFRYQIHYEEARAALGNLIWKKTVSIDTKEEYTRFAQTYPNSNYATEAAIRASLSIKAKTTNKRQIFAHGMHFLGQLIPDQEISVKPGNSFLVVEFTFSPVADFILKAEDIVLIDAENKVIQGAKELGEDKWEMNQLMMEQAASLSNISFTGNVNSTLFFYKETEVTIRYLFEIPSKNLPGSLLSVKNITFSLDGRIY